MGLIRNLVESAESTHPLALSHVRRREYCIIVLPDIATFIIKANDSTEALAAPAEEREIAGNSAPGTA